MPPRKSWKVLEFLSENFQDLESPGKWPCFWKVWNLLGNDVHGSFWLQIDMFMQTKIAIIVFIRYVFWAAGMPKMLSRPGFLHGPRWQSLQRSPRLLSCCLLLYLNIAGLQQDPGKMLLGSRKVLELTNTLETLIVPVCTSHLSFIGISFIWSHNGFEFLVWWTESPMYWGWLIGCLTSHSTHYRLFRVGLDQLVVEIRLQSHQNHSTMLHQYNSRQPPLRMA